MPELTNPSQEEFEALKERARKLALEKSYLQLVNDLIRKLGAVTGVEDSAGMIARLILNNLGGLNVAVYYIVNGEIYCADAYGSKKKNETVDDEMVREALDTCSFIEEERDFDDTKMMTPEFTKASHWALPLSVGEQFVGVLKMEGMLLASTEIRHQLEPFFNYAALVLKNEIENYARLQEAFEQVRRTNAELEAKMEEIERMNKLFVGRELRMIELKEKIKELEREKRG